MFTSIELTISILSIGCWVLRLMKFRILRPAALWIDCETFFVFSASKADRRLVLFYLANDVLQNSRKKGKEFSNAFTKILREAMQLLRFVFIVCWPDQFTCLERSTGISSLFLILLSARKPSKEM